MLPYRTHKTHRSDDELVVFDVLFRHGDELTMLVGDEFDEVHNLQHRHSLDLAALREAVAKNVAAGYLWTDTQDGGMYCYLTAAGGQLWELERDVPWERYCEASYCWSTETDERAFVIRSPSPDVILAYLGYVPNGETAPALKIVDQAEEPLIYWRRFPEVYEFRRSSRNPGIAVKHWLKDRPPQTWWTSLNELFEFVQRGERG